MMDLHALVSAVQLSVSAAGQALQEQNNQLLGRFFEPLEPTEDTPQTLSLSTVGVATALKPKCVTLMYPQETATGLTDVPVTVPLISLVPISAARIQEVRFSTQLEVGMDDNGAMQVAFPSRSGSGLFGGAKSASSSHLATLEIVLNDSTNPEGLQLLVEGYERALRAQIPG